MCEVFDMLEAIVQSRCGFSILDCSFSSLYGLSPMIKMKDFKLLHVFSLSETN